MRHRDTLRLSACRTIQSCSDRQGCSCRSRGASDDHAGRHPGGRPARRAASRPPYFRHRGRAELLFRRPGRTQQRSRGDLAARPPPPGPATYRGHGHAERPAASRDSARRTRLVAPRLCLGVPAAGGRRPGIDHALADRGGSGRCPGALPGDRSPAGPRAAFPAAAGPRARTGQPDPQRSSRGVRRAFVPAAAAHDRGSVRRWGRASSRSASVRQRAVETGSASAWAGNSQA